MSSCCSCSCWCGAADERTQPPASARWLADWGVQQLCTRSRAALGDGRDEMNESQYVEAVNSLSVISTLTIAYGVGRSPGQTQLRKAISE